MTIDIFSIDTCVITLLTLEWLGALMIEHVFLEKRQLLGNYKLQTEVNLHILVCFIATDLE